MSERTLTAALAEHLRAWLPQQRWFAGKGSVIDRVWTVQETRLSTGALHAVIGVTQPAGQDHYQLLLGSSADPTEHQRSVAIGELDGRWYYDVTADPDAASGLLDEFGADAAPGAPRFEVEPGVTLRTGLRARPIAAEQSNTSVVFGQHYILKLFRKLSFGENRDLRVHRKLRAAGSEHIAAPVASVSGVLDSRPVTFGIMQEFLAHAVEGWQLATASVRDLMAEADLHAAEVGGDFAAEAHRLGAAVARVHADLADAFGTQRLGEEELAGVITGMHQRLDLVLTVLPELSTYERPVREAFAAASGVLDVQQVHGDLHLGQTLRTNTGWVLIDFEGEPGIAVEARDAPQPVLADVAGMIRSFDYAAHQHLVGYPVDHQHAVRAKEWAGRNADAFCDGYAERAADPRAQKSLLRAFVLHKAVYEVAYEHTNRPDWLDIPLGAIRRGTG